MDRFSMFQHFAWVHNEATLTVCGEETLPKCNLCGMQVRNMERHQKTKTCERLQRRRANEELQDKQYESEKVSITVNGRRIERVRSFTYLGRVLTQNDDDTTAITTQLERARKKWGSIVRILKNERAEPEIMARFYITVVMAVLLYGAESWTISKLNMNRLNSFHNRAVRYLT